jgi:hypothetical protein
MEYKTKMEKEREPNKWKTIAIIFIVLFVLETLAIGYVYKIGADATAHEEQCANEICYVLKADTYFYDPYEGICQCFTNEEVVYERQIG